MATMVINLNLMDLRELEEGDEYIGREHESRGLKASIFANPFPLTPKTTREEVLLNYYHWFWQQLQEGKFSVQDILRLDNKRLACFCHPQACHGHVLQKAVEWAKTLDLNRLPDFKSMANPIEFPRIRSLSDRLSMSNRSFRPR